LIAGSDSASLTTAASTAWPAAAATERPLGCIGLGRVLEISQPIIIQDISSHPKEVVDLRRVAGASVANDSDIGKEFHGRTLSARVVLHDELKEDLVGLSQTDLPVEGCVIQSQVGHSVFLLPNTLSTSGSPKGPIHIDLSGILPQVFTEPIIVLLSVHSLS